MCSAGRHWRPRTRDVRIFAPEIERARLAIVVILPRQPRAIAAFSGHVINVPRIEGIMRVEVHPHTMRLGPSPGQHAAAAGHAKRRGRIGIFKPHAAARKRIKCRAGFERIAFRAGHPRAMLVGDDEDDVRRALARLGGGRGADCASALFAGSDTVMASSVASKSRRCMPPPRQVICLFRRAAWPWPRNPPPAASIRRDRMSADRSTRPRHRWSRCRPTRRARYPSLVVQSHRT